MRLPHPRRRLALCSRGQPPVDLFRGRSVGLSGIRCGFINEEFEPVPRFRPNLSVDLFQGPEHLPRPLVGSTAIEPRTAKVLNSATVWCHHRKVTPHVQHGQEQEDCGDDGGGVVFHSYRSWNLGTVIHTRDLSRKSYSDHLWTALFPPLAVKGISFALRMSDGNCPHVCGRNLRSISSMGQ